ncbi:MAG: MATE family efflux transporter [Ruthenibacterium sp.]
MQNTFTEGKILPAFIRFSLPLLLAMLLQSMYGAVDLLIVGQFSDAAGVSAVSTGSQIAQIFTNMVSGLAMGSTVLLGQYIGANNEKSAARTVGATVSLFGAIALCITVLMLFVAVPFARLLQAPPEAFDATVSYVRICGAGTVFVVAYNAISSVFRGIGNSKLPLIFVAIACVVNVFGDLLLVAVFGMGASGAAIATVFAQGVSVVLSLVIIRKQGLPFAFHRADLVPDVHMMGRILKTGFPIALQSALTNISFLVLTGIFNGMGVIVSAGVGVSEKICNFIMLVPMSFMSSLSAFVAQNIGANKPKRAMRTLEYSIVLSVCFGLCMFYFAFFHGDLLAGVFSRDAAVVAAAADYLKAYAIDCILVAFLFSFMGYFNGCGRTVFVMVQGVAGSFLVRIPVSFFISRFSDVSLFAIGLATPIASAFSIGLCFVYFYALKRNTAKKL